MFHRTLLALPLLAASIQAQQFLPTGSVPLGINTYHAVADFNLDGRPDFAAASAFTGKLKLFFGNPDGSFTASSAPLTDIETPTGLATGDFDNDGKTDIVVLSSVLFGNPAARVFLGSGTGALATRPALVLSALVRASATGDFNLDGNLDLAIITSGAGGSSVLTVLRGNGKGDLTTGLFSVPVTLNIPISSTIGDLQSIDVNGDTRPDLVMTILHSTGVGLAVAIADAGGSFAVNVSMGTQPPQAGAQSRLAVGDFNGDRVPDIAMFGYYTGYVTLWTNFAGMFSPQLSVFVGPNLYDIAAADFDLDGRTDWAVGKQVQPGATPELYVGLGRAEGGFTLVETPFSYGGSFPLLEAVDINGDRRMDLLVLEGNADAFRVLLNSVPRVPTLLGQEIQFPQIADRALPDGPLTLTATATSGLPVTFAGVTSLVCTVSKGVATFVSTGICTVIAMQPGDLRYGAAPLVQRSITVARTSQTITFAQLEDRSLSVSQFTVTATASSGLSPTFTASPSSVCTVAGSTVTLVAVGQCSITASQAGNGTFPAAAPVTRTFAVTPVVVLGPIVDSIANAASYSVNTLAPASYAALLGSRLSPSAVVKLRDALGATFTLEQTFSNATQINFIVPAGVAKGAAAITVTTGGGAAEFPVTIAAIAPGLFSSAGTGQGLAAAQAQILNNDRTVTTLTVGDSPIPVRGGTEIYLVLYGTGIRAHTANGVSVTVGGLPVEVLYAGPQGTFPALDQVNVRVPLAVGGFGTVDIRLVVDGVASNIVTARFQ